MKTKTKTKKAAKTDALRDIYFSVTLPNIKERDPICKRCNSRRTVEGHHRKGKVGTQDGVELTIYEPLIMGVCRECHTYIEQHRDESYKNHWLYHRNRPLPFDWQKYDLVLNPELKSTA